MSVYEVFLLVFLCVCLKSVRYSLSVGISDIAISVQFFEFFSDYCGYLLSGGCGCESTQRAQLKLLSCDDADTGL